MADDLEENFQIEDEYIKKHDINRNNIEQDVIEFDDEINEDNNELKDSNKKKKSKKKTITEILALKKNEVNKPAYIRNELKRLLNEYILKNLSVIEKTDLNLNNNEDLSVYLDNLIMKSTVKGDLATQIKRKYLKKFQKYIKNMSKCTKKTSLKSQPYAIVLCSSAKRCITLQKTLNTFTTKQIRWMLAFSKHKQIDEQLNALIKTQVHLVYATPQRLIQLLSHEKFNLKQRNQKFFKRLRYIIIDYRDRDCKLKRFIDHNEIRLEFFKFFFKYIQPINSKFKKNRIKFHLI